MADFNISNLTGNQNTNFDSLLNIARTQLSKASQEIQNLISQQTAGLKISSLDAFGVKVQIPQLANFLGGQADILLKTSGNIDKNSNVNLQIQTTNISLEQGKPVLQIQGQITQIANNQNSLLNSNINNQTQNFSTAQPQKFTAEIPLNNQALQNFSNSNFNFTATSQANSLNNVDEIIRNFLPSNSANVTSNNLTPNIKNILPQNLQNLNLNTQNNFNIQINSITTPNGQQLISNNTQNVSQPTQSTIISGQIELAENDQTIIRTEFGNFRIAGQVNLPSGSNLSFSIVNNLTNLEPDNILNLNPTNLQTLKLSLENPNSPLQEVLKNLNSSQNLSLLLQRFFPNADDKNAFIRNLFFVSASAKASPEGWLNQDGELVINKIPNLDTNLPQLKELFGVLQNFAGKGQQPVSTDWNSYIIPIYDGSKLSFATIQVQRDPEGKAQQTTKGKRKFIIELEQDKFGRLAIEGLFSRAEGRIQNLDIVIKSENEFAPENISDINEIFNQTALAYGFGGTISFSAFVVATPLYADVSKILGDGIVI